MKVRAPGGSVILVTGTRANAIRSGYRALDHELTAAAQSAHNLALVFADYRVREVGFFELAGVLTSARAGARTLGAAREFRPLAMDRARQLVGELDTARNLAALLAARFPEAPAPGARGGARNLAPAVEGVMVRADSLVRALDQLLESGRTPGRRSGARQSTAASARRLLRVAARLLPAGDRARYAEEFGSELADIALAGGRRRAQLAYAARQLRSAPRLRADLKSPRRRSAAS